LPNAVEKQWVKFPKIWVSTEPVEIHETPTFYMYSTGMPHPLVNGVGLAYLEIEDIELKLEEAKEYFKKRDLPWTWWVGPTNPPDLGAHLERLGLIRSFDMPGMAVDLDSIQFEEPTIPDFEVKVVDDMDLLREWVEVVALCFSRLPMSTFKEQVYDMEAEIGFGEDLPRRNYLGYLKGKPVAVSTYVLGDGAVGLFTIGTLPEARRRGIGSMMTFVPMRDASSLGYKVAVLHSSDIGYSMYEKIGFKEYCTISAYNIKE